jgi:4'-phosphopantetheinyl transferase
VIEDAQRAWRDSRVRRHKADLWCVRPEQISDETELQHCRALLTPEERRSVARFARPDVRRDRLVSKALLRTVLSAYADVPPTAWRFRAGQYGKPEIDTPVLDRRLCFSLSHTEGLIACLVARSYDVGVDVECVEGVDDVIDIAVRYFGRAESSSLLELPKHDQIRRFFELWTLKEAYAKARGLGVLIPFDAVVFEFDAGAPPRPTARFGSGVSEDASRWQFTVDWVDDTHVIATACCKPRHVPTTTEEPRVLISNVQFLRLVGPFHDEAEPG